MQQYEGHVLADNGGRLEQLLVVRREPVDPGRQDHLDSRRDLDRLDRPRQTIRAALPGQRPRLHQRADALLDEEGIPASDQQSLEGLQRRVIAQESCQELARALGRERVEPQLTVVGLVPPAMLVLGPVVDQQEKPGRGQTLHQAVEQGLRLGIDPVQVLEDHEHRLPLALPEQEVLDRVERALPALGRIERLPAGVIHGHIEESQEGGEDRLEGAIQREELAGHLLANLAVGLAIVHLEVGLEEVDDRQVAGGLAIGHGARFQDEPVLNLVGVGELVDEAGLPHAGFPHGATSWPRPSCARASARRSCSISASRPTNRVNPRAAAAWSRVRCALAPVSA